MSNTEYLFSYTLPSECGIEQPVIWVELLQEQQGLTTEESAQMAIKWYLEFQTNRGATPMTAQPTQVTIESQIMEFIE